MLNALTALVQYQLSKIIIRYGILEGLAGSFHPQQPLELFLGNAGTAMRPLAAALSLRRARYCSYGWPHRERASCWSFSGCVTVRGQD